MAEPASSDLAAVGTIGGVVTLLGVAGAAIRWLVRWGERRVDRRHAKLDAWQRELTQERAEFATERELHHRDVEKRLAAVEGRYNELHAQNLALRMAHELVAGALRVLDPGNPALRQADQLLTKAFPLIAEIPSDMSEALFAIGSRGVAQ